MPRLFSYLLVVGLVPVLALAASICETVASRIPGRITYPGSSVYEQSRTAYYSAQERALKPGCLFTPLSTTEVSQFVKIVNSAPANSAQFAVRGGGHTLFSGAANINGGVTVDMRAIKSVVINKDGKSASIGGGAIWSEVYPQLVPHNLTAMGGRVPGIAVGGFTMGGGVSFLARKHGWGCDNVFGYEVVLASGEIAYASASSNKDLWLALKGGSSNFGIVTRFDVAVYPQGKMWGGAIQFNYTKSVLDGQAKAFANYASPKSFDEAAEMSMILTFQNPGKNYGVLNSLFYTEPVANPPVYKEFLAIPSLSPNSLGIYHVDELVLAFGKALPASVDRTVQLAYSFKHSDAPSLYSTLFQTWEAGTKPLTNITNLGLQFLIQPHPVSNGTNSLGLPAGAKDIEMGVLTAIYPNSADDAVVDKGIRDIVAAHEKILREKGLYIAFKYLNYADITQDVIASYGADTKRKLQAVSRKYDPKGLFQTGMPGGVKVFP